MSEFVKVEIVGESNRVETESIDESIRDKWVGAVAAYKLAGLTKSSFQRAVSHLLGNCECRVESLRRGDAKNTRYSELAIALIKARKAGDEALFTRLLDFASKPSGGAKVSVLAVANHVATLDQKIANLRQATNANSEAIGDRIESKLAEIARCHKTSQQRTEALSEAELLAAENRGIEQALAIFSAEEAAKENALAHLRALKISGNQ